MSAPVQLIIFDLDGTLLDTGETIRLNSQPSNMK